MTNEKILKTFLKKHKKYTSFKCQLNMKNNYYGNMNETYIENALLHSFGWNKSKEGYKFWSSLNTEWKDLCKHFNLTGTIKYDRN